MSFLSNVFSLYNDSFAKITPADSLLSISAIKQAAARGSVFAVNLRTGVFTIVSASRLATCGLAIDAAGNVVRNETLAKPLFTVITKEGRETLPGDYNKALVVLEKLGPTVEMVFSDQPVTALAWRPHLHWDDFVEKVRRLYQASYREKMKSKKA
jgi:hypothetical protein